MHTRNLILFMSITITLLLAGCGGKSITVKKPQSELTADKTKAYVILARPYMFMGSGAPNLNIIHFDNKNFKTDFVASLSPNERTIYPVKQGTNYFYITTHSGMNNITDNIQMINAKSGHTYYVFFAGNTQQSIPILYEEQRTDFVKSLKREKCSTTFLNRYLFEPAPDDEEKEAHLVPSFKKDLPITNYQSAIHVDISCQDGKVIEVQDTYQNHSLKELQQLPLVKPTPTAISDFNQDKKDYLSDLKTFYSVWIEKFNNVPATSSVYVDIKQIINTEEFKKYPKVQVMALKNNKIKDGITENITKSLQSEFHSSTYGKTVMLQYRVNLLSKGDAVGRFFTSNYITMGLASKTNQKKSSVIDISVFLKDVNNNLIGEIRISSLEDGGWYGLGAKGTPDTVIKTIAKYVKHNLIQD